MNVDLLSRALAGGSLALLLTACGSSGKSKAADLGSTPVATCTSSTVGTWESITPAALNMSNWCSVNFSSCNVGTNPSGQVGTYGTTDFLIDPTNSGTVYLGTSQLGIWKTTDCGSNWVHINTGNSGTDVNGGSVAGSLLDGGRQWTMVMDPADSKTIYATAGYGAGGIFRSTDGGVDWSQILPSSISSQNQYAGFIEKLTMDPTNHLHLLASFHTMCIGTALAGAPVVDNGNNVSVVSASSSTPTGTSTNYQGWGCLAETKDGGTSWAMTTSAYPWVNSDGPGQTMVNATTWFYGTNGSQGLWRTTTAGVSVGGAPAWTEVNFYATGGASQPLISAIGSVYVAHDGSFYSGGNYAIVHSKDGINWTQLSGSIRSCLGQPKRVFTDRRRRDHGLYHRVGVELVGAGEHRRRLHQHRPDDHLVQQNDQPIPSGGRALDQIRSGKSHALYEQQPGWVLAPEDAVSRSH